MALSATLYKADLQIADLDRGYYADHNISLALHPSETLERLMVRVLAFALHADPALEMGRGLSTPDEPALWRKDYTGAIQQWIELGQPEERRLRQACARAAEVIVYNYAGRGALPWWRKLAPSVADLGNLRIVHLPSTATSALADLAARNMRLQITIQEGVAWVGDAQANVEIALTQPEPG